jgi:transposase-like protein
MICVYTDECEIFKKKHQLEKENAKLREELIKTKGKLKRVIEEFEEYKAKYPATDFISRIIRKNIRSKQKKRKRAGQKKGHKGHTRSIPNRIDVVKTMGIEKCPDCNGELSNIQEVRERYVEDIPEISNTIITKYQIERRYCKCCKKMVEPIVPDALPNARFGLRLMSFVVYLKEGLALSVEKILELLRTMYNLSLSDGEIIKILEQITDALGPYYQELKREIKEAKVKHSDETSWGINGRNYWLWTLVNKKIVVYLIRKRRNYKVPAKVLGNQEGKMVISDRHSTYNSLEKYTKCLQQKCWSHILRDSKDLAKHYKEARAIHRELKSIYIEAKSYDHRATREEVNNLLAKIDTIGSKMYKHSEVRKFVRSICVRHRENLFRFVTDPDIDGDNNLAERALRKGVIIRKISHGNRSNKGARILEILLSVVETLKHQEENVLEGLIRIVRASYG